MISTLGRNDQTGVVVGNVGSRSRLNTPLIQGGKLSTVFIRGLILSKIMLVCSEVLLGLLSVYLAEMIKSGLLLARLTERMRQNGMIIINLFQNVVW